jgi:hypothetical protein
VREIVDMPDRRAALFVRLCMQNSGLLAAAKRLHFAEPTDAEVARMESEVGNDRAEDPAFVDGVHCPKLLIPGR